jgi:hypothetical protein
LSHQISRKTNGRCCKIFWSAPNFNGGLYIRGVVNQAIEGLTTTAKQATQDPTATPVTLFDGGKNPPVPVGYESMVPKNIKEVFGDWQKEILGAGVHIHSKVVVLDPFGENPVVMTGSHNLGYKASHANDDNLMIIQGNAPLAAAYATNIIAIYQTYRWNAYVEAHRQDPKAFHGLEDDDAWQAGHLQGEALSELKFWLGSPQTVGPPPAPPASGDAPARSSSASGPAPAVKPTPAAKPTLPAKKARVKNKAPAKHKKAAKKKAAKKKPPVKKKKTKKAKKARRRRTLAPRSLDSLD